MSVLIYWVIKAEYGEARNENFILFEHIVRYNGEELPAAFSTQPVGLKMRRDTL